MNTTELNVVLSDEIRKLRSGKSKPERTNAVSRAAAQIIGAARLELTYMKMVGVPQATLPFFDHHGGAKRALPSPKKSAVKKRR